MNIQHAKIIAKEYDLQYRQVDAVLRLLEEGATIPFISRYRKERTGNLDEVVISNIKKLADGLKDLESRREYILKSIEDQGKLTDDLRKKILECNALPELEDIYLPYKTKRKTKASIARDKGLEPLASQIFEQKNFDVKQQARNYINRIDDLNSIADVLDGARDIMAEWINENPELRSSLRDLFKKKAFITSKLVKGKEASGQKFKDYFSMSEPISKIPSHRLLAMMRGEKEGVLRIDISPEENPAIKTTEHLILKGYNDATWQVKLTIKDAYKRLLKPSLENEIKNLAKARADEEAILVFSDNLKQLLLAPALGQKKVLAIDPGFRTGCKAVCLDSQGKLLVNKTIFPHPPQKETNKSGETIRELIEKYKVEAIGIGNGTAGRETETFVRSLNLDKNIVVTMVNESGASIYSASELAREEFPNQDLTVRGAISIGRRLMDPLAELVKIDPKSIGVGQYQHDVDQTKLRGELNTTVESCVNAVGVELNTASKQLLQYVSGLGPQLAENIVQYRNSNGSFTNRSSLKKVPRLGEKAFEQCAGFLRIRDSKNVLDRSAVHPESYNTVKMMARDLNVGIEQLMKQPGIRQRINLNNYISEEFGLPTLQDIMTELERPGRDPREKFDQFQFAEGIEDISQLKMGMKIPGIVTNITKFGAFVDIGVHQDGLVHISQMADKFVDDPAKILRLQQKVMVTITDVNIQQKRISLSLKSDPFKNTLGKSIVKTKK